MAVPRFSEDVRTLTDLKVRSSEIVRQLQRTHRPVLLTRRGRGVAVILNLEQYEHLVDRAEFVEAVQEGAEAVARGDVHPHEEAVTILESFGEPTG